MAAIRGHCASRSFGLSAVCDFQSRPKMVQPSGIWYFDPPYHPLSPTSSFTSYTSNSFSEKDQTRLAEVYRQLDKKGCLIMLSNSYSDFILELYSDYRSEQVSEKDDQLQREEKRLGA